MTETVSAQAVADLTLFGHGQKIAHLRIVWIATLE
jgi:hypothetical protein